MVKPVRGVSAEVDDIFPDIPKTRVRCGGILIADGTACVQHEAAEDEMPEVYL